MSNEIQIVNTLRDELDVAVTTAKAYPRNVEAFLNEAKSQVSLSPEIARSMWYSLPRKDASGKTIAIEGPSIRLAEVVLSCWGNIRIQSRIKEIGDTYVVAEAIAFDMEKNIAICKEARRRIVNSKGLRYSEDMIQQTAQATTSIAIRNALFTIIPKVYIEDVLKYAKDIAMVHPKEKKKSLQERFAEAVEKFKRFNISKENILKHLNIKNENEFTEKHLQYLWGVYNSLDAGDIKPDDVINTIIEDNLL